MTLNKNNQVQLLLPIKIPNKTEEKVKIYQSEFIKILERNGIEYNEIETIISNEGLRNVKMYVDFILAGEFPIDDDFIKDILTAFRSGKELEFFSGLDEKVYDYFD